MIYIRYPKSNEFLLVTHPPLQRKTKNDQNSLTTFWVYFLTDRQTDKRLVKTYPPWWK